MGYQIFTDATADLTDSFMAGLPHVEVIPMRVEICNREFTYGPGGDLTIEEFYQMQRAGNYAQTTQINPATFIEYFEPALKRGDDVLYLCFSSGISSTYQTSQIAMRELQCQHPDRKVICIDSLSTALGLGLLVREAARLQGEGASLEEVADWVMEHRGQMCYRFVVDTFDHLHHGGRVSTAASVAGTMLNIKPMLRIDEDGRLEPTEKCRGHKRALVSLVDHLEKGWLPELGKTVLIVHADCPDYAAELNASIAERVPEAETVIGDLGPIIAAHTGPGLLAVIYWGSNR